MKLNLRGVDLNLLTVFQAVLEEGQLLRAANRLGMSQPAVSNALLRLRHLTNDPLFLRTHGGMLPTPRARELGVQVGQALSLIEQGLRPGHGFDPATAVASFQIAVHDTSSSLILAELQQRLLQEAPGIVLMTSVRPLLESRQMLMKGELDFTLDFLPALTEGYVQAPLLSDELVVIARQGHPRIRGKISEAEFFAEAHVMAQPRSAEGSQLEVALGRKRLARRIGAQMPDFTGLALTVSRSDMLGVVPGLCAALFARDWKLQVLPPPFKTPRMDLLLIWHASREHDPGHRWLRETLLASASPVLAPPPRSRKTKPA